MVRFARDAPNRVVPPILAAVLLLLAGCDFLGLGTAKPTRPSFEMTDDLFLRTEVLSSSNASSPAKHSRALSLTPVVRVRPPTVEKTRTQAGHLSYDTETQRLYVGYKLAGPSFGGGIDILNVQPGASPGDLVDGHRSFRSTNVDITEVQFHAVEEAVYTAGAVATKKRRLSPAVVSRIVPGDSEIDVQSKRLTHNVAKGILLGTNPNAVYVPTDENALFRLDLSLNNQSKQTVENASGFRSATLYGGQVFVLDQSGRVFETDASAFQGLSEVVRLTDRDFGNGTVARVHADADRLYAALNERGFALFSPSGEPVWKSSPVPDEARYTCVSTGPTYVYAGRFDGVIEVYQRPESLSEPPEKVGTFGPWTGYSGGQLSNAPINQIQVIENHLYVARSRDGMVVLRIDGE